MGFGVDGETGGLMKWLNGAQAEAGERGRGIPRDQSRELPGGYFSISENADGVFEMSERGVSENRLAGVRVVRDVEPLSPRDRDAEGQPGGGNAMAAEHVFHAIQPLEKREWPSFSRPLQKLDGGS